MTIVVTGGGSGGHITPILAVTNELKLLLPDVHIIYIGQIGDSLGDIVAKDSHIETVYAVRAGKFRRYHGEGLRQLLDLPTLLKNIRDMAYVVVGFFQSRRLLKHIRPDSVFIKGGFVGVPVGLAAASLGIKFITHDSDAVPGLANRIISRWATLHTVALPKQVYSYPLEKTVTVGVPVHANYSPITAKQREQARQDIGLGKYRRILLITGGGLGAKILNDAMADLMESLLDRYPDLAVIHTTGRLHEAEMNNHYDRLLNSSERARVKVKGYVTDLYRYSAAANIIVARAGATNLAEFAVQGKACVIVPNPLLAGGHQLKNAEVLSAKRAVKIVTEQSIKSDNKSLQDAICEILDDDKLCLMLESNLAALAKLDAANRLAVILLELSNEKT